MQYLQIKISAQSILLMPKVSHVLNALLYAESLT